MAYLPLLLIFYSFVLHQEWLHLLESFWQRNRWLLVEIRVGEHHVVFWFKFELQKQGMPRFQQIEKEEVNSTERMNKSGIRFLSENLTE